MKALQLWKDLLPTPYEPPPVPCLNEPAQTWPQGIPVTTMRDITNQLAAGDGVYTQDKVTGHQFCEGLYSRQYFLPKGCIAVSLMHSKQNFFLVVQGECMVYGTESTQRIKAPFMCTTEPGTKRIVYGIEDTVFVTFHPNPDNETDLVKLEQKFIIPEVGVARDLSIRKQYRKQLP